jgi:hypothetical protein
MGRRNLKEDVMITNIKALIDCAVVAGNNVYSLAAGQEKAIEITKEELKFSVDRGDVAVIIVKPVPVVAKPVIPAVAPAVAPAPVVPAAAPVK